MWRDLLAQARGGDGLRSATSTPLCIASRSLFAVRCLPNLYNSMRVARDFLKSRHNRHSSAPPQNRVYMPHTRTYLFPERALRCTQNLKSDYLQRIPGRRRRVAQTPQHINRTAPSAVFCVWVSRVCVFTSAHLLCVCAAPTIIIGLISPSPVPFIAACLVKCRRLNYAPVVC